MPDYVLKIEIRDVTEGDVRLLASDILDDHGDTFDADLGSFVITASVKEGGNTFPIDLDDGQDPVYV